MNLFKIFNKKESVEIEVIDPEKENIVSVSVRDIKQYLVNEFDRSKTLEDQIEILRSKEREQYELKIKHDAALVTLEAYNNRIKSYEEKMTKKDNEINSLREELLSANEKLHDQIIINSQVQKQLENFDDEVKKITDKNVSKNIMNIEKHFNSLSLKHKGVMSKDSASRYLKEAINSSLKQ